MEALLYLEEEKSLHLLETFKSSKQRKDTIKYGFFHAVTLKLLLYSPLFINEFNRNFQRLSLEVVQLKCIEQLLRQVV